MARELTVMACASHAERVAQRWDGLEGRIKDKLASLGLDQQAVGRLLTQAIRSSTRAKKVMWLRQAADAAAMRAQPHAACRQGCAHCCHIAVVVTKAEALQIAAETGCYVNSEAGKPPPLPPKTPRTATPLIGKGCRAHSSRKGVAASIATGLSHVASSSTWMTMTCCASWSRGRASASPT